MRRRLALTIVLVMAVTLIPMAGAFAAPKKAHPVRVPAGTDPWVSTGIHLEAGDAFTVTARGLAITGPLSMFPAAKSGPGGQATVCPDPGGPNLTCAHNGSPYGALVGSIGGTTFYVGSSYSGTAPAAGTLMLAVNDNLGYYFDNLGGFTVFVSG